MSNPFISFTIKAAVLLTVAFCIHLGILKLFELPIFDNRIVLSYSVNLILIVLVFGALFLLKNKYKSQLGFLFLFGSLLKFAVFFIVFYPFYRADSQITNLEFAAFFVPYILGLIIETFSLSRWLNALD